MGWRIFPKVGGNLCPYIYIYIYSEPERGSYSLILGIQSKQWKTTTSRKHAPQIPRHIEEKE